MKRILLAIVIVFGLAAYACADGPRNTGHISGGGYNQHHYNGGGYGYGYRGSVNLNFYYGSGYYQPYYYYPYPAYTLPSYTTYPAPVFIPWWSMYGPRAVWGY